MKIAELLQEEVEDLMTILQRDCKPYLDAARGKGLLSRGISNAGTGKNVRLPSGVEIDLYKKAVRKDRRPTHTTNDLHKTLDDWFYEKFGVHARSETVFCLGKDADRRMLELYGHPYLIFPIGNFSHIWSPRVSDLYVVLNFHRGGAERTEEGIRNWLDERGYTDQNLADALRSNKELMVKCDSYYAIDMEYEAVLNKALGIK